MKAYDFQMDSFLISTAFINLNIKAFACLYTLKNAPGSPGKENIIKFFPDKTSFRPAVIRVGKQTPEQMEEGERSLKPEAADLLGFMLPWLENGC